MSSNKINVFQSQLAIRSLATAALFISIQSTFAQDNISAEITHPTKNYECRNGFIDLTIDDA